MTNEDRYSNREIREFVQEIKDSLGRIETQTVKTNGRVTKLEADNNMNKGWIRGISACIATVIILGTYIFNVMTSPSRIKGIVRQGFNDAITDAINKVK